MPTWDAMSERELDAWVARLVMGWDEVEEVPEGEVQEGDIADPEVVDCYGVDPSDGHRKQVPPYSSSPQASAKLRAQVAEDGLAVEQFLSAPSGGRGLGEESPTASWSPREYAEAAVKAAVQTGR